MKKQDVKVETGDDAIPGRQQMEGHLRVLRKYIQRDLLMPSPQRRVRAGLARMALEAIAEYVRMTSEVLPRG